MLKKRINKYLKVNSTLLLTAILLMVNIVKVEAAKPHQLIGYVNYLNGSASNGNKTTPNSFAKATGYRYQVPGNTSISNVPKSESIFPASYSAAGDPAIFMWDVGSSAWNPEIIAGQTVAVVTETYKGLNGWTGSSWVGGVKQELSAQDLIDGQTNFPAPTSIVMEQIPTPTLQLNSSTAIILQWQGLWDNSTGAFNGVPHNSIIGYSIYRSDNGSEYQVHGFPLATVSQNAGGTVTFTDSTVELKHNYKYKLSVNFMWSANNPAYFETTAMGPESVSISPNPKIEAPIVTAALPESVANDATAIIPELTLPSRIGFLSDLQTLTVGNKSKIITIGAQAINGDAAFVRTQTKIELTSTSSGEHKKFFAVEAGVCGTTEITSLVLETNSFVTQFCYYDESASSPTWLLSAHKLEPEMPLWIEQSQAITVNTVNGSPTVTPSNTDTLVPTILPSVDTTIIPTLSPVINTTIKPTLIPTNIPTVSSTVSTTISP